MRQIVINRVNFPMDYFDNIGSSSLLIFLKIFTSFHKLNDEKIISTLKLIVIYMTKIGLVFDDLLDDGANRSSKPCVHRIFGVKNTASSVLIYQLRLMKIIQQEIPEKIRKQFLDIVLECQENTFLGQMSERFFSDNLAIPTEEEIKEIIILKGSSFIKCINNMVKLFTKSDLELDHLCELFAIYEQMKNDIDTFINKEYFDTKKFAEDITEGKMTIPIVHAIKTNELNESIILNILKLKTNDEDLKKTVVDIMEKSGSFEYAKKLIENAKINLINELKKFEKNEFILSFIK